MYKVEKSKEDTWEPWKLRSRNFSMTSEEFLMDQKLFTLLLLKAVSLYFITWSLTAVWAHVICLERMVVEQWLEFDINVVYKDVCVVLATNKM